MWEVVPTFIFSYMKKKKQLDIYIDESGDFSLFTKENPLYSVAFIMVKKDDGNDSAISKFNKHLDNLFGGDHFVHVGNLVRAEKPYEDMNREERWHLFYTLFLLARHAKYKALVQAIVKRDSDEKTLLLLTKTVITMIKDNRKLLEKYHLVLHYDFGQGPLAGIISSSFLSAFPDCEIIKTPQSQNPFMQLADLFAYFELLTYKIEKGFLTKSETKFFGGIKNLKSNYLESLYEKYL